MKLLESDNKGHELSHNGTENGLKVHPTSEFGHEHVFTCRVPTSCDTIIKALNWSYIYRQYFGRVLP